MEQILCSRGYDNQFAGVPNLMGAPPLHCKAALVSVGMCISLLIGCGLVGAVLAGLAAARWACFEEILKICGGLGALAGIGASVSFSPVLGSWALGLALAARMVGQPVALGALSGAFGFFAMGFYGVGMDVGAEISHPVAETTSAGILVFSGRHHSYRSLHKGNLNDMGLWAVTCNQ